MSCLEPHVCGVCGLWVRKSRERTEPALCREHQEIIDRDLVAVVEWQFAKIETNSGTSFQSRRTGNIFYLTIDEFRQIFVEYQGGEPVPILIDADHSGLEDVRENVAALYRAARFTQWVRASRTVCAPALSTVLQESGVLPWPA